MMTEAQRGGVRLRQAVRQTLKLPNEANFAAVSPMLCGTPARRHLSRRQAIGYDQAARQ